MFNRVKFNETKNWSIGKGTSYVIDYSSWATPFSIAAGESHSVWNSQEEYYMSKCFSEDNYASFEFVQED